MTSKKKQTSDYAWLKHYPEGVKWDVKIPALPLYSLLDASVEKYPDHVALSFFGKHITYKQLGHLVEHAARGLQDIGVKKGTKIGLFLPNCPHYVIMYYATLKLGATVVNFNPLSAFKEMRDQVVDSGATIIVTLDLKELFSKVQALLNSTTLERVIVGRLQNYLPFPKNFLFPILKHKELFHVTTGQKIIAMQALLNNDGGATLPDINPTEDIALLQYTGGTTGVPKAAALTHANLYANTVQCSTWFSKMEEGKEVLLAVLPFFHCFAMTAIMNLGIEKGAKIVIHPRFNLDMLLKDITNEKITILAAVPTIFSAINHSHYKEKYDLSSLKLCVSGGAALPQEIKETFEALADCPLAEGYGLTEASPVICVNPFLVAGNKEKARSESSKESTQKASKKVASAGLPLPATVITIRDIEDTSRTKPQGEIGEICVSGPQVMKGYYNNPEETELVLKNGLLRTGDLGYMDRKGFVYIVDRLKEMIISGGFNVYPRHVEEALYQHHAVKEVAVLGKPEDHRGEIVVAYITLQEGQNTSKEDLRSFLKNHLSPYEIPREFHFVDSLPKTPIGKICKKDLKNV